MPHDDPAPIHRTRGSRAASRKLRAERDLRRICKSCDSSRRKSIRKAGVCRTKGTQFKSETSIDSGKQEKEKDDKRRGLKEEFARRNSRRPDRARCYSAMKLDQCDREQGERDQETKRGRKVLGKEKSTQTKHPPDEYHDSELTCRVCFENFQRRENHKERYGCFDASNRTVTDKSCRNCRRDEH